MKTSVVPDEYIHLKECIGPWPLLSNPIESRRFQTTIGINILGESQKACSFDCPYCELGQTSIRMMDLKSNFQFPSVESIESTFRAKLQSLAEQSGSKNLVISGNGEPTLHPDFESVINLIVQLRNELAPTLKIAVLSNGSHLDDRKVIAGLNKVDERMIKLDAGNDDMLKKMNQPIVRLNLTRLIAGTRRLTDVIIQSMFLMGSVDNTTPNEIEDWIECVGLINPKLVHIYSLARVPPVPGLIKVPEDRLDVISAQLERRTRIKSIVF